jgi:PEP-CTERM/exosortase A-associated glycosyltransferase
VSDRTKIIHILDHSVPLHSGYTFRSQNIFHALAKRGWELSVLTSPKQHEDWKGPWQKTEIIEDIPHLRTGPVARTRLPLQYEIRIMQAIASRLQAAAIESGAALLHAHSPVLNGLPAIRVARKLRIPCVYEIRAFWEDAAVDHGSYREGSFKYRLVQRLETYACRKADHIVVICDGLRQDLIRRGIPPEKISIVRNGINVDDFRETPPDSEFIEEWGIRGRPVIAFIGSFYRYEGLDLLVESFSRVLGKIRNAVLLLVGGGEMKAAIRDQVARLGIQDSVRMPGRIPHHRIPGVYAISDVLAYPRYSMRLTELVTPLKPLEAMAMGRALVASDVGGHKELIQDGKTGLLFPSGEASALAAALEKLLTDDSLRSSIACQGREWVRREHPWEKTTATYDAVYGNAMEKLPSGQAKGV